MQHWSNKHETSSMGTAMPVETAFMLAHNSVMELASQSPDQAVYVKAYERKRQTQKRLQWVQSLWDDTAAFDAIVASGRYLKLCAMLEWATTNDEIAGLRLDQIIDGSTPSTKV